MRLLHASSVACLLCCVATEDSAGECKMLQGGASLLQISAGRASLERHRSEVLRDEDRGQQDLQKHVPDNHLERGLHRVVGKDGVFMISLPRGGEARANFSKAKLSEVGIDARIYTGTDGRNPYVAQEEVLDKAIDFLNDSWYRTDEGRNESRWAAALADSHMRAWEEAQRRQENWTAILEDDVVPILAEGMSGTRWLEAFEAAWRKVPLTARFVRMGYCWAPDLGRNITANTGDFMVTTMMGIPGICTTGYIVHKDAIPDLLSIFPCDITLDVCLYKYLASYPEGSSISVADRILANIEVNFTVPREGIQQYGILKQDRSAVPPHYADDSYFASLVDALVTSLPRPSS